MDSTFGSTALATITALTLGLASGGAQAQTTLQVANWLPPVHPIVADIVVPWGERVAEVTEGRVQVEIMSSPLGSPPAHFDIARDGLADVTYSVHGYTPGRFTLTQMAELPFLSDTAEALSVAYWRVHESHFAAANEHEGVKLLGLFAHGPGHIYTTSREISALSDASGLRMRIGSSVANQVADAMGMSPMQVPSTEVYEVLSRGVADGIFFPHESVPFFRLESVLNHGLTFPGGLYNSSFFLVMNEDTWNSLSPEDQAAIDSVSGEALAVLAGQAWDAADAAGLEAMQATGLSLVEADAALLAEMQTLLAPIEADWIEAAAGRGVDGAAALEALRAEIAAYGAD